MNEKLFWVYILKCDNNNYYTGYTTDLAKRYQSHLDGKGSKYTRSFKPQEIAQAWQIACEKSIAMKIENAVKKLSRIEKEELIKSPEILLNKFSELMQYCKIYEKSLTS